jgi:DNA polymerase I-like protein with 3'-5' exonuclease and polymerase domains
MIEIKPNHKAAYRLLHDGLLALADVERNGIRVDVAGLVRRQGELERSRDSLIKGLDKFQEIKEWKKRYGTKFNVGSNTQLRWLLYTFLRYPVTGMTERGLPAVDADAVGQIDSDFARHLLKIRKIDSLLDTFIPGLLREQVNGVLHPFFNLNMATTYRSSSDSPNFQNFPIRDKEQGGCIRSALCARPGHRLGESDFKGLEVGVGICYHQDPVMIDYWNDRTKDMHRDMACECFMLELEQVTKEIRYLGKNGFVFPEFYGSYWAQVAPAMWQGMQKLSLPDGILLRQHLADKGIRKLGENIEGKSTPSSFMAHIRDVEHRFWHERFTAYRQWKEDWWKLYQRTDRVQLLTGFTCSGVMSRNDTANYPVQGAAFHCLLWTLIRLNKYLKENGHDSMIVGQIHDSMVKDYAPAKVRELIEAERHIIRKELPENWPWIIVPLEAEFELCPVDGNWNQKKKYDEG